MVKKNNRGSEGKLIDVPISSWLNVTDKGVTNTQRSNSLSIEKRDNRAIISIKGTIDSHIYSKLIKT